MTFYRHTVTQKVYFTELSWLEKWPSRGRISKQNHFYGRKLRNTIAIHTLNFLILWKSEFRTILFQLSLIVSLFYWYEFSNFYYSLWSVVVVLAIVRDHRTGNKRVRCSLVRSEQQFFYKISNSANSEPGELFEQCERRTLPTVRIVRTANSSHWANSANSSFFRNRRTRRTVRTGANTVRWSLTMVLVVLAVVEVFVVFMAVRIVEWVVVAVTIVVKVVVVGYVAVKVVVEGVVEVVVVDEVIVVMDFVGSI